MKLTASKCVTIRAMVTKKEVRFLKTLFGLWIALGVLTLVSAVLSVASIYQENSINNNIFELIYMAVHLIAIGFAIMVTLNAFKKGSFILRGLTYGGNLGVWKPIRYASAVLGLLGLAMTIYGILILLPLNVYSFSFPITLKWLLVDVGLFLFVLMAAFFLFPFLFACNPTLTKKRELELRGKEAKK